MNSVFFKYLEFAQVIAEGLMITIPAEQDAKPLKTAKKIRAVKNCAE